MVDFYNDFLRSERDLKRYLAVGRNKEELFSLIQRAVEEHPYIFANVINVTTEGTCERSDIVGIRRQIIC